MAVLKRVTVAQHECALVWKNRSFERVLEPGVHWIFEPLARVEVQTYDLSVPEFEHPRVDFLVQDAREMVERNFQLIELKDREIGLVFRNEHLVSVLAPGKRQLFWRGPIEIRVELRDISEEFEIDGTTRRAREGFARGGCSGCRVGHRGSGGCTRPSVRRRRVQAVAAGGSARVLEVPAHAR